MSFKRKLVRRPGRLHSAERMGEMIRVDHAGEYGAVRIYQGQRAVFDHHRSKSRISEQLVHMEEDEQHHLDAFDDHIRAERARPTVLAPIWNLAGFVMGAGTALMSEEAAHTCTEAVETVIEGHYGRQVEELRMMGEHELADQFHQFQLEEVEHKDLAVQEGAHDAFGYPIVSAIIKAGCHTAIEISQRV